MVEVWDQSRVEEYITQGIEESLTLDYKAAGSLAKTDGKRTEITKDVSAMANSAGGIIIYGMTEDATNRHLPGAIDPVDRNQISKEWLEQIISNIRPKIGGLVIYPVPISTAPNHVVYVVDIPQGYTAHQATDKRYYKRFNFQSEPMEDYEIRDVMNRDQHPLIVPKFGIFLETETKMSYNTATSMFPYATSQPVPVHNLKVTLAIFAVNEGAVFANYVNINLTLPTAIVYQDQAGDEILEELFGITPPPNEAYQTYSKENTERDVLEVVPNVSDVTYKYGPSRYVPILPKRYFTWDIRLSSEFLDLDKADHFVEWEIFADNATAVQGKISITDIKIIDKRSEAD